MRNRETASADHSEQEKKPSVNLRSFPTAVVILGAVVLAAWTTLELVQRQRWGISADPRRHAGVGRPLAPLNFQPLTGDAPAVSRESLEGRVVLINFWGTWCSPCRVELPHMAALRERFAGRKAFQLLSVSYPPFGQHHDVQSLSEETLALQKRLGISLPTYYDPENQTYAALQQVLGLKGSAFPTTVLLDRQGILRAVWIGYRPGLETEMERITDDVLQETE